MLGKHQLYAALMPSAHGEPSEAEESEEPDVREQPRVKVRRTGAFEAAEDFSWGDVCLHIPYSYARPQCQFGAGLVPYFLKNQVVTVKSQSV